jgi:hypothetical protein
MNFGLEGGRSQLFVAAGFTSGHADRVVHDVAATVDQLLDLFGEVRLVWLASSFRRTTTFSSELAVAMSSPAALPSCVVGRYPLARTGAA